jgi:hypothetical protein
VASLACRHDLFCPVALRQVGPFLRVAKATQDSHIRSPLGKAVWVRFRCKWRSYRRNKEDYFRDCPPSPTKTRFESFNQKFGELCGQNQNAGTALIVLPVRWFWYLGQMVFSNVVVELSYFCHSQSSLPSSKWIAAYPKPKIRAQ